MTAAAPENGHNLDVSDVAAVLEADPTATLGAALWQKAQLTVLYRQQGADLKLATEQLRKAGERIADLEKRLAPEANAKAPTNGLAEAAEKRTAEQIQAMTSRAGRGH